MLKPKSLSPSMTSLSCPACPCRLHLWTPPEPAEFPNPHSLGLSLPHTSQQGWCFIHGVTGIQYPVRIKTRVRCPMLMPVTPTASKPRVSAYWRGQLLPASSLSFLAWFMGKHANKSYSFFLSGTFFSQIFLWFIPSCPQILPSVFYHGSHSFTASFCSVASIIPWHKQSY